jgi:thiamine biosynthesis lipoprotein
MPPQFPPPVTLARHAMATRFELVLHGDNSVALRAAGEEALEEIDRLEAQLSLYRSSSEIAHLNARAAREPVRVTPSLFGLLQRARTLHQESRGAFDITVAPLVRCWGFMGGTGRLPGAEELAEACAKVGMHLVELNPEDCTVRFARAGVMLDLGAIGKGYAIERAAEVLREAGVASALLHGGTSTAYALGHPPEAEFWTIALDSPGRMTGNLPVSDPSSPAEPLKLESVDASTRGSVGDRPGTSPRPLATIPLRDQALSVSAVWGRCFQAAGKTFGHVLDPRTGQPAADALLAAVSLPSATETDALSTALLTLGPQGHDHIANLRPDIRTLLVSQSEGVFRVQARGIRTRGKDPRSKIQDPEKHQGSKSNDGF